MIERCAVAVVLVWALFSAPLASAASTYYCTTVYWNGSGYDVVFEGSSCESGSCAGACNVAGGYAPTSFSGSDVDLVDRTFTGSGWTFSLADSTTIGFAVALLWVTAWGFRQVAKALNSDGEERS